MILWDFFGPRCQINESQSRVYVNFDLQLDGQNHKEKPALVTGIWMMTVLWDLAFNLYLQVNSIRIGAH